MKSSRWISMTLTMLVMAGCGTMQSSSTNNQTPLPVATAADFDSEINPSTEIGELTLIDEIMITFLESFPLQIHAVIKGSLPDGCTRIQSHEVGFEKNTFIIRIYTEKQIDLVCAQSLFPFEYVVPLDVFGFPAGNYTVLAYENSAQFTFSQDNVPESDGVCTLCFPDPTPEDEE